MKMLTLQRENQNLGWLPVSSGKYGHLGKGIG
jgi:hypothetical protein